MPIENVQNESQILSVRIPLIAGRCGWLCPFFGHRSKIFRVAVEVDGIVYRDTREGRTSFGQSTDDGWPCFAGL